MSRPGARRPLVAVRADEDDAADLDSIATAAADIAGERITRSDVVRAGVELLLRGVDRDRLTAYLAEVGRESPSGALTPERRARLLGEQT